MRLTTEEIERWVSQDLLETCAFVKPVSEPDYCQVEMTATVMGEINAAYTLECAHHRHLLAARALNERSWLIRVLPFPHTQRRLGTCTPTILSSSVFLQFFSMSIRRPSKCNEPMLYMISSRCLRTPASQAVHS